MLQFLRPHQLPKLTTKRLQPTRLTFRILFRVLHQPHKFFEGRNLQEKGRLGCQCDCPRPINRLYKALEQFLVSLPSLVFAFTSISRADSTSDIRLSLTPVAGSYRHGSVGSTRIFASSVCSLASSVLTSCRTVVFPLPHRPETPRATGSR